MGMAASQARYLALVARKSNCEYEGQQINQARTALSNQSANLFNQMLGLQVPIPPSTQDFTKTQYSYTDGLNDSTISSWQQLATPEEEYNYVVTHYYYTDVYTGSEKKLSDPQVQFAVGQAANVEQIEAALNAMTNAKADWEEAQAELRKIKEEAATLSNYVDKSTYTAVSNSTYAIDADTYTITRQVEGVEETETFVGYEKLSDDEKAQVDAALQALRSVGVYAADKPDLDDVYYNAVDQTLSFRSDLKLLRSEGGAGSSTVLPTYNLAGDASIANKVATYSNEIAAAENAEFLAQSTYDAYKAAYESLERPTYIGNCELTLLPTLTDDQRAELQQVVKDLEAQGIEANISDCFTANGDYLGGVYQFTLNGITYFTTYDDLEASYESGTGINNIDGQAKMAYYNASYVSTKIEETEKALLETDGSGRFVSVRLENDSITYTLNMETVTDEIAYQDAMNQYYYENAKYDKMIQDINAKTSIIQREDQQLELRLKQLDTEQRALSTEIDAVSKVVQDNVESSFKTFGG